MLHQSLSHGFRHSSMHEICPSLTHLHYPEAGFRVQRCHDNGVLVLLDRLKESLHACAGIESLAHAISLIWVKVLGQSGWPARVR